MKSYNHLFERLIDENNIRLAIKNASKNKHNRPVVQEKLKDIDKLVKYIQYILINNLFKPRKHKVKIILDGSSKKEREIIQPDFCPEQIIHHAVINVLKSIFMKGMYYYSCGSVPDRGGMHGKRYIEKAVKNDPVNTQYVAKLDIKKYFKNIKHDILKAMLKKIIHDKRFLNVLFIIIDSYPNGLPLGYYTSQWFANFYLQGLDWFIKQILKIKYYVRYMDDMVLLSKTKDQLKYAVCAIRFYLFKKLGCFIKENEQIFPLAENRSSHARCIDFMGYKFFRNYTLLRKTLALRIIRKTNRVKIKRKRTWYDALQLTAYFGWIKHTDTYKKVYKKRFTDNKIYMNENKKIISFHSRMKEQLVLMAA